MHDALIRISLILLVFAPGLLNASVTVKKENGRLLLSSSDCDDVRKGVSDLMTWGSKFNQSPISQPQVKKQSNGRCYAEIDEILADHVSDLLKKPVNNLGPNCVGTALVANNMMADSLRFYDIDEMFSIMEPLCEKSSKNPPPQPGDVVVTYSSIANKPTHAFVYLNEQLTLSKKSFMPQDPVSFKNLTSEFNTMGVSTECQNSSKAKANELGCEKYAEFFRCQTISQYLEENKEVKSKAMPALKNLKDIDCILNQGSETGMTTTASKNLIDLLEITKKYAQDEYGKAKKRESKDFWDYMQLRLLAIEKMLVSHKGGYFGIVGVAGGGMIE